MCSFGRTDNVDYINYVNKIRWISYYHQIDEILAYNPKNILEIGAGMGVLGVVCKNIMGINYTSIDNDENLNTDFTGSVISLPFSDNSYELVCCFQVLEHLPFEDFDKAFSEICRVAEKAVIISLPNASKHFRFHFSFGNINIFLKRIFFSRQRMSKYHFWEINQKGYKEKMIKEKINEIAGRFNFKMVKDYRVVDNRYHHFFILEAL